jgi:hypothetical protein
VVVVIYNIIGALQTRKGLGLPVHLRPAAELSTYSTVRTTMSSDRLESLTDKNFSKLNFVGRPLYQLAVCNYKVCACLGYRRLFERTNGVKYMGWIATFVNYFIFVIIVSHFATTLVIIFQCHPVEKSWKPWIGGRCLANYPTWNVRVASTCFYSSVPQC